jgi:mycothiol synthase
MPIAPIRNLYPLTSDEDAESVVAFRDRALRELIPRRADITVEEFLALHFSPSEESDFFGVDDGSGELAALGMVLRFTDGANAHLVWAQIFVRSDMRRTGLGRRLLSHVYELTIANGRSVIGVDTFDTVPAGDAFAASVGAEVGMREQINVVRTDSVDTSMLQRWTAAGPGRAPGYELLRWIDGYPQERDAQLASLFVIADEDMPFEDASFEPTRETAATVRERLERSKDTIKRVTSVAMHVETDAIVGFSELIVRRSDRNTLFTTLTAVHRDHQGLALGKWLKADAILRAMERWPDATHIQTENAHSNAPMLGINHEIGFEMEHTSVFYEATVEQVRAYLDSD